MRTLHEDRRERLLVREQAGAAVADDGVRKVAALLGLGGGWFGLLGGDCVGIECVFQGGDGGRVF